MRDGLHLADPRLLQSVEEFGDEWGNKLMFHHRWFAEVDQVASAQTLACLSRPDAGGADLAALTQAIRERMTGRVHFVGSSAANAPLITRYYLELLDILEPHLAARRYLFGDRPAFGDFGLAGQRPNRRLEQAALPKGEQSRLIRGSRLAADDRGSHDMAIGVHQRRSGPAGLTGRARRKARATGTRRHHI